MGRRLIPGRNCWRIARAERVAFIVDAADYFAAFADAVARARHSIVILGWDIHSRTKLRPGQPDEVELGPLLSRIARERPELRIDILVWDYALVFALEREYLPLFQLGLNDHPNVSLRTASDHAAGGCMHHKIVVIDDALAFSGGIDLTIARWDERAHAPSDPRRVRPNGRLYAPFHDVQIAVDGEAARALGDLARARWREATGLPLEARGTGDPWPPRLPVHLEQVDVALSRTVGPYGGRTPVREVEQLWLDAIGWARRSIYIENQHLTSNVIRDALAARLEAPDAPEVVIVTPLEHSGQLEALLLGAARAKVIERLRPQRNRLRICYPVSATDPDIPVEVHAKVMVVDDEVVRVGSANLTNRSMRLDGECDLTIDAAGDGRVRAAIARFRNGLLSEHLGVPLERVEAELSRRGSLIATLDALARQGGRTLRRLEPGARPLQDYALPVAAVVDPDSPLDQAIAKVTLPEAPLRTRARRRLPRVVFVVAGLMLLAAAWKWTPLGQWLNPDLLAAAASPIADSWLGALISTAVIALATLLMVPVTLMIVVASLVLGPWLGAACAMLGALLSAACGYGLGRLLVADTVRAIAGTRAARLSQALAKRGLVAMLVVRVVPVAPFTVVNVVAGSAHIAARDFIVGTLIGMAPGLIALSVAADRISAAVQTPSAGSIAIAAAVIALVLGALLLLRRLLDGADAT